MTRHTSVLPVHYRTLDLETLWRADGPSTTATAFHARSGRDHLMLAASFATLSVMALILVLTLWAIQLVARF